MVTIPSRKSLQHSIPWRQRWQRTWYEGGILQLHPHMRQNLRNDKSSGSSEATTALFKSSLHLHCTKKAALHSLYKPHTGLSEEWEREHVSMLFAILLVGHGLSTYGQISHSWRSPPVWCPRQCWRNLSARACCQWSPQGLQAARSKRREEIRYVIC